jgi:predicted protein tyrosine phosphatase
MIHVCSLSALPRTVEQTGARHVISLLGSETRVLRPQSILEDNHLWLQMHDIAAPVDGHIQPGETHVENLLRFVRRWDRGAPLVVHCYAGISRSTAGAFVTACALNPQRNEAAIAQALRDASPTASPNSLLVSIADQVLGRNGRMIAAIESIGRGVFAEEAEPFHLALE